LLKVDSISVCFSVAVIMDYHSILAYSIESRELTRVHSCCHKEAARWFVSVSS